MSSPYIPTPAQTLECFRICYQLTEMYRAIYMVRLDDRSQNIIVLADNELIVEINSAGASNFP
jgi:hypothetical protein